MSATKKPAKKSTKPRLGMIGCGTAEQVVRRQIRERLNQYAGVTGIEFKDNQVIVRVVNEEAGQALPKTCYRRKVSYKVTGVLKKQGAK